MAAEADSAVAVQQLGTDSASERDSRFLSLPCDAPRSRGSAQSANQHESTQIEWHRGRRRGVAIGGCGIRLRSKVIGCGHALASAACASKQDRAIRGARSGPGAAYLNSFDLSTRSTCARLKQVQVLVSLS